VLGSLAALGYDAEWHCIPACAVGAPHRRDRVWIVAYPDSGRCSHICRAHQRHKGCGQRLVQHRAKTLL
jgi:DNA (cytosine-5)-methyltransferase 1